MRRGIKFSKKAYIILGITALFNLLSIVFDQLVVQQEDKIRIFDKEMNNQKIEVNSILYAHKVFEDLMFKTYFGATDMTRELHYLVKIIDYFNSDLPKKIESEKIDHIKKTYFDETKNVVEQFHIRINDTKIIFNKITQDLIFMKSVNKKRPSDSSFSPNRYIQQIKLFLNSEYKSKFNDFWSNYNFNAKTTGEQTANYPIFDDMYDEIINYTRLWSAFYFLSQDFKEEFSKSYAKNYILLDEFAEQQNKKNYLILFSILFQIIGLVSLVILFRVLILENR